MKNIKQIEIIQPDDWHVHLREGEMLKVVTKYSTRINGRCIIMPNLINPITNRRLALEYINQIKSITMNVNFTPLLPCYLTENLDLNDFKLCLQKNIFFGAKFYPTNATTNSKFGINKIENIFPALEILEELNKPLLVHGEKLGENINIFDREKYFIDEELIKIRQKFSNLKITLEHVSSKYGADFVDSHNNTAGTITPQHMLLTKKDFYFNDNDINPHHFCMPVVKEESDLISLRKYACSGNKKFFLGTDSAPHHIKTKRTDMTSKPGIFSAPLSIELYATIFEEENSLDQLEKFSSINGPNFYNLSINENNLNLIKKKWLVPNFTNYNDIKIKNFMSGREINWKVKE